jgi:uncharacterized protein (DUF1697 family)
MAKKSSDRDTFVLLLRGVNVGGKNKLPMALLSELLCKHGCVEVRTYIQSGNAVFTASRKMADGLCTALPARIEKALGFAPPLVIRSLAEMSKIAASNPFPVPTGEGRDSLHVLFLSTRPTKAQIAALDANRSPGDRFAVVGSEIYLYLTQSSADTKLTNAYFDSKLATMGTGRNWRTVITLHQMMRDGPS